VSAEAPWLERPLKVTVSYTHTCNLDCAHCYADCGRSGARPELSAAEWTEFIDRAIADGVIALYFEGGEPLHRPDFLGVLHHAGRRAMTMVRTNGTLLTPAAARSMKEARVALVFVDLMGARAETHDALTRVPGSHARTLAGIGAALDAGLEVRTVTILNRQNARELQEWAELSHALGIRTAGILRPYPIGRMRRAWPQFALSLDEMTQAVEGLRAPAGMRVMHSWHPNDANCCWQMAAVNAWGDSIGCAYLREFVDYGNIREKSLLETWNHPLCRTLRGGEVERACGDCAESQGSSGGCRSTAYAFHGRWDAPDPFDRGLNDGTDLRVLPEWMLAEARRPPGPAGAGDADLPRLSPGRRDDVPPQRPGVADPRALRRP
jgi:radical SAM protein with 4Fe4S-binding SPASM domain